MKLLIVILNYRVTELTIRCLQSLAGRIQRVPESKVAVCENGTGGDAADRLRRVIEDHQWSSWVELTEVHPNRGFTGGNNLVIRAALASSDPPEYFLLLNADTLVQNGALEALVDYMDRHPRAGIAGSRLLSPDGEIQGSPFRFHNFANQLDRSLQLGLVSRFLSRWASTMPPPSQECSVDWVSGASMILRRSMLEEVGLLDEGLYTYFDDVDLCLRAKRAGWETGFVPASRIVHLEGASTGVVRVAPKRRPGYWFQARRRYFLKNYGAIRTALYDAVFIVGSTIRLIRHWIQSKPDTDPPSMVSDLIAHSVFRRGFKVNQVENPALSEADTPPVEHA